MADGGTNTSPQLIPVGAGSTAPPASSGPQLINTTPAPSFPASTSSGVPSPPATGATPQLVPTVGSTDPAQNTPIPGSTSVSAPPPSGPSSAKAATGVIPNAQSVPASNTATIAPVNPDSLVSNQLAKDLAAGSPLIDLARSQSLQQSAARGLANSSLAAQAGETAAIGSMLPVAQQDASTTLTTQTQNLAAVNNQSATVLQGQVTSQVQQSQIANQLLATLQAQAQQGSINYTLQAQTEAANINQILTQGSVNSMLSSQQAQQQIEQINQTSLDTINQINAQAAATASQDGPALQAQYLTGVTNIMTSTAQQIQAIYQTQGLSADQQANAVVIANQQMQENINNLAAYYASSPLWDTGQQPTPIPKSAIPQPAPSPIAPPAPAQPTQIAVPLPGGGTTYVDQSNAGQGNSGGFGG